MEEAVKVMEIIRRNSESQDGGFGGSNIYSDGYRQDFDNDSSTDEEGGDEDEASSDDDQDFTSKFGKIATQTSGKGKVRIKASKQDEEMEEEYSEDDFEADMEKELAGRLLEAEKNAAIARTCPEPEMEDDLNMETTTSKGDREAVKDGKYSDVYFDSDEEESEDRKVLTNDDLFYDPDKDDEDQEWVDSVRQSYHQSGKTPSTVPEKLPNSDAVLNCPACFTVLCLDCQRHEVYNTQYRAMFVVNCTVNTEQKLKFPVKGKGKKGKGGKGRLVTDPNSDYHPVICDNCKTEVAMYDQDEVYHFFNVVASHS